MRNLFVFFVLTLFILINNSLYASETKKWGKVDPYFLNMTVYPEDTSAAAVKIFDIGELELWVGSRLEFFYTHHYQIKILKERAKSVADIVVPYYYKDKVIKLKAHTILPSGKKIKVKKKNIFNEEQKNNFRLKKFTLPSVEVGSIIEVEYKILSKYINNLEPWVFQDDIPTVESLVSLKMSPGFSYKFNISNDNFNRVKATTKKFRDSKANNKMLDMFIWNARDLPAVKKEPYISTLKNYKARIHFQIARFENQHVNIVFIKDFKTLSNELLDGKYGSFLKPSEEVKALVAELTNGLTDEQRKIKAIFEFTRDQLEDESYNSSIYTRKKQNKILKSRKASDSERNLLLITMLKAAGFEAKPILISTRNNGRADPSVPFLSQYNRTLAFLQLNNKVKIYDASDRYTPFGLLPPNSIVSTGLLIEKDNPQFVRNRGGKTRSVERVGSEINIGTNGELKGHTKLSATGYVGRRRSYQISNDNNVTDFISNRIGSDLDEFKVVNADTILRGVAKDTFTTSFEFEINDFAEMIDGEMYFRPGLYHCENKNIFISTKREFPIEFPYRWELVETNVFLGPAGYLVAEIPQNVSIENEYFTYSQMFFKISDDPVKILYERIFKVKKKTVPSLDYAKVKNTFAKIVDADQAQIVIKANR